MPAPACDAAARVERAPHHLTGKRPRGALMRARGGTHEGFVAAQDASKHRQPRLKHVDGASAASVTVITAVGI